MKQLFVQIIAPFDTPDDDSELVVFSPQKSHIPEYDTKQYLSQCIRYAAEHEVFLVTGVFAAFNYLCLCLIDPKGKVLGTQRATHLNSLELEHFRKSDSIKVIPTPFGRVFLCVDVDVYRPALLRMAKAMGAELVIASQYFHEGDYHRNRILTGPWNMAQQNSLLLISVSNKRSCITAPCASTKDGSGFLVYPSPTLHVSTSVDMESVSPSIFDYSMQKFQTHEFLETNAQYLTGGGLA